MIRELWAAGRGEAWERTLRLPEPVPAEVAAAARQDLVAVLLCLVIAPVVAFTASLTLPRRRRRDGLTR